MKKRNKKTVKKSRDKSKLKKPSVKGIFFTFVKSIIVILLTLSFILGGVLVGAMAGYVSTTPPITDEQLALDSLTTTIYDSKGNVIAQLKGSDNKNRIPVKLSQISEYLQNAIVAIEDERFFTHPGVDIKRTVGAFVNLFVPISSSKFGGSTITQQLVKNITGDDRTSIPRKIREQWRALQLEQRLSKEQILETYLNVIYMGSDCYGVQAAAKAYFKKDASDLNLAESAFLAGITNNPSRYNPLTTKGRENAIKRQKTILYKMLELEMITKEEYEEALKTELEINTNYNEENRAKSKNSYFVDQVILDVKQALIEEGYTPKEATNLIYGGGIKIYSTLDSTIQKAMDSVFKDVNYFPSNKKIDDPESYAQAAMVIIDPNNGYVKALYGGYGEKEVNMGLNRATQVARPAGSSIKPIVVYGPLIDAGIITPASIIDDAPVYMNNKKPETRYPTNYSANKYPGLTTVRDAVARSSNVVAAKLFAKNMDVGLDYLKNLGIDRTDEKYVSVALGGLTRGVNTLDMAAAFVPFANKGFYYKPLTFTRVLDRTGKPLVEKKPESRLVYQNQDTPTLMTSILNSVVTGRNGTARGRINIKDKNGKTVPVAGKTGTSDYHRDSWFVGYTPHLVGATWYGFDMNESIPSGEGSQSTIIWNAVMANIHKNYDTKDFYSSPTVVRKEVCKYSGKLVTDACKHDPRGNATITEYFSSSNVPTEECDVHVRITLCKSTNKIANENCPDTTTSKVYIKRPEPYKPKFANEPRPQDIQYDLPENLANLPICDIHKEATPTPTPTPGQNDNTDPNTTPNTGTEEPIETQEPLEPTNEPTGDPGNTDTEETIDPNQDNNGDDNTQDVRNQVAN